MRRLVWLMLSPCLLLAAIACGGDDDTPDSPTPPPATTAATSRPTTAAASPPTAATTLTGLSLVYWDRSKGQGAELYTAAFDGAGPKKVATIAGPSRPLDLRGKLLAVAGNNQIFFYDLTTGTTKNVTAGGTVSDGRFLDNQVFLYTSNGGCGPQRSVLMRVDLNSMEQKELVGLTGNLSIAAVDAASSTVAIVPRGCDPGVQTINLYGTNDGREIARLNTPGCGHAAVSLAQKKAFVSWMSCSPTATGAQATFYDFSGVSLVKKDVTGPSGGINSQPVLLRPGANEAVFATKATTGTGPGSTAASGVWLVDFSNLSVSVLVPGEGAEQTPLRWTDDGRYLLVQSVQAQGLCSYSYADATNKQVKPMNKDITFCGVNGEVIGWTSLK